MFYEKKKQKKTKKTKKKLKNEPRAIGHLP